jgi:hypothetical protein
LFIFHEQITYRKGLMRARSVQLAAVILLVVSTIVVAQGRPVGDVVSGRWSLVVRTTDGPDARTLELAMARDSSIAGTVTSLGSVAISGGRLDRDRLRFEFAMAGGEIRVTYDLVVRADTLRGVFRQDGYEGEVLGIRGDRAVQFPR